MISLERIAELRALAEKATPGSRSVTEDKYENEHYYAFHNITADGAPDVVVALIPHDCYDEEGDIVRTVAAANAALIGACDPETILELLDAAERESRR